MCSYVIVCALLPRFELVVAAGGREALSRRPVGAGSRGRAEQLIGRGLRGRRDLRRARRPAAGRGAGALPELGSSRRTRPGWRTSGSGCSTRLEGIGAAVEPGRGRAWRASTRSGLRRLHGGLSRACSPPHAGRSAPGADRRRRRRASRRWPPRRGPRTPGGGRAARRRRLARLPRAAAGGAAAACERDRGAAPRSSASACARWASWRRCRAPRWPTASGRPALRARGARPRPRHAAAPAHGRRACWRSALELPESASGAPARARARPADRPAARPARAPRPHAARRRAVGAAGRGRHLARARDVPGGPGGPARGCGSRSRRGWPMLPAPAEALRLRAERFGPPAARPARAARRAGRAARRRACARRSARRAPPPGPRLRCACSPSTPTRACPSGGSC